MAQQLVMVEKKPAVKDELVGLRRFICSNGHTHKVAVAKYADGSVWVLCPYFGYMSSTPGCKIRHARCRFFKST